MNRTLLNLLLLASLLLFNLPTSAGLSAAPKTQVFAQPPAKAMQQQPSHGQGNAGQDDSEYGYRFFSFRLNLFNLSFFIRLLINLASMFILLRLIYYRIYQRSDYFFTFFMFNITIFVITYLLNSASNFTLGAAFGLFAIFAMLRYRTEAISTRDMTYLFAAITLGLISSVNMGNILEILIINGIIILSAWILEGNLFMKSELVKTVEYEKIELIKPVKRQELLADLEERTGLHIHKINIRRIDFLRDTASIAIYYYGKENKHA